jgi:hypothetical protein
MVSNDAGSYTVVKAEAAAGGAEGPPLQGYSSQRQFSTKVSGPPLAAALTLAIRTYPQPRHAKFAHSKFKRAQFIDDIILEQISDGI